MEEKNGIFPKREDRVHYSGGSSKRSSQGRKKTPRKKSGRNTPRKKITLNRNALYLAALAVILLIVFFFVRKNGTEVFVGTERVGILEGRSTTEEQITKTLESQLESVVGSKVKLNEKITTEGVHIGSKNKKDVCTMEHLLPKVRNMVTYKVDAAIILVDNGKAAILANKKEAETLLEELKKELLPEGVPKDAEVSWLEKVEIKNEYVDSGQILSKEDAITALKATTEVTQSYTVQTGDALYLIANKFKTTTEKLKELNNGTDLVKGLYVGQVINVPVQKPRLSVKTVETQILTAVEPKTYETQYDDTKPSSYQKVIQQGKAGQKKSTIQITRVNGDVIEEKEVDKEIITEAVPEIILKGTK